MRQTSASLLVCCPTNATVIVEPSRCSQEKSSSVGVRTLRVEDVNGDLGKVSGLSKSVSWLLNWEKKRER